MSECDGKSHARRWESGRATYLSPEPRRAAYTLLPVQITIAAQKTGRLELLSEYQLSPSLPLHLTYTTLTSKATRFCAK